MLMTIRKNLRCRRGFTLLELVVVIAIIGILAAILIPNLTQSTQSAKNSKMKADMRSIDSALAMYYANNKNAYPADAATYKTAMKAAFNDQEPTDAQGNTFTYATATGGYTVSGNDASGTAHLSPASVGYVAW